MDALHDILKASDGLQLESPAPPPLAVAGSQTSVTQSGPQVAVSAEATDQMRVLANIMIDVFLERRKVPREAKEEARGPELQ
jgi:hypothetical protein